MKKQNVFIVIPTIRNLTFLKEWGNEFKNCTGIIIEDHQTQEIETPAQFFKETHHYTWTNIRQDFGKDEWIFSRKNAGIRSYGFYKAWKLGADVIITLDDDCYPFKNNVILASETRPGSVPGSDSGQARMTKATNNSRILYNFVNQHLDNLNFKAHTDWFPTYPDPKYMYTRGFPYKIRNKLPVMVSHGLWSGALDLDAQTEVKLPEILTEKPYPLIRQVIPQNYFFPMCSMNLAFQKEVTPLMYFPLMGYDPQGKYWGFDRFDDIWAGLFVKKICDHLGFVVVNGSPFVEHRKASLPVKNLEKEKPGLRVNEDLWKRVREVKLTKNTQTECYIELTEKINFPQIPYFTKLREAMLVWITSFK